MDILMMKTPAGALVPLNEEEADELKKIKTGHVVECKIVRKRNPLFMRKFFALIKVAFDAWSEVCPRPEWHGVPVQPNLKRFRKDMIVWAGYYEPTFTVKGDVRLEPLSISFGSMEEEDFEKLFSAVMNVALERILTARGYTEETLRAHVDRVLSFDK